MKYAFGDTDLAARRLKLLADLFAESSRPFILEAVSEWPATAVDLGCGPGYSTRFLARLLKCQRVAGLDNSERFIAMARAEKAAALTVSFHVHDVTKVPFPTGPVDLLYARLLLTHLAQLQPVIAKWATQLRPGGPLLIEEVESAHTANCVFRAYLEIVEAMLSNRGSNLYVGRALRDAPPIGPLKRRSTRVAPLRVANNLAARMFWMNIQTWKHDAFVRDTYRPALIGQLEDNLRAIALLPTEACDIEWRLRQLVYQREGF